MDDDAMMRASREPMTIAQLKRSMDARFKRVDQRFGRVDQRFNRVDRRFERIEAELRQLRQELREQAEETRRHMDVVVESMHDDFRLFAEAIRSQSERLGGNEVRLRRLEQRRPS